MKKMMMMKMRQHHLQMVTISQTPTTYEPRPGRYPLQLLDADCDNLSNTLLVYLKNIINSSMVRGQTNTFEPEPRMHHLVSQD